MFSTCMKAIVAGSPRARQHVFSPSPFRNSPTFRRGPQPDARYLTGQGDGQNQGAGFPVFLIACAAALLTLCAIPFPAREILVLKKKPAPRAKTKQRRVHPALPGSPWWKYAVIYEIY